MDEETNHKLVAEINEIINSRESFIFDNYLNIRFRYFNTYQWPEIDPVRNEICLCLLFGLSQAAITLTNHLMESALKNALIVYHSKQNNTPPRKGKAITDLIEYFSGAFGIYDKTDLSYDIDRACSCL